MSMYNYGFDSLLPPETPGVAPEPTLAPVPAAIQADRPATLTPEEISDVGQLPPVLQQALAPTIAQYRDNPAQLAVLVREALDLQGRIERGEDPAVSPDLAQFKQAAQSMEQDKHDQMIEVAQIFTGPVAALTAAAAVTPQDSPAPAQNVVFSNATTSIGTTIGAFLDFVENTGPTRVPDVRAQGGPAQGFSLA